MFVWNKSLVDGSTERDDLVDFCENEDINCILLNMYSWLGSSNWSSSNVDNLQLLIRALKDKGIKVYAMAGNTDWGTNQKWVKKNIITPIQMFNKICPEEAFDGFLYDVEYFTVSPVPDLHEYIPAFCKLIEATKVQLQIPVGCWIPWWSMASDQSSPFDAKIEYDGLCAVHGEHLLRAVDEAFVGSYSNIAVSANGQVGQIEQAKPFVEKANEEYRCKKAVWVCAETKDVSPSWITYYGKTKSQMEAEFDDISDEFNDSKGSSYAGIAVHHYETYKDMS
jgi:hypothetical protein